MSYLEHFEQIVNDQLARVERMKASSELTDYAALDKIIIGTIDGDGIGPVIMDSCRAILEKLLADDIASGKIELRRIEGLTLENRIAKMETVPAGEFDLCGGPGFCAQYRFPGTAEFIGLPPGRLHPAVCKRLPRSDF